MKKLTIIFIAIFGMTFAFQNVNAQQNAAEVNGNSASANVIQPITLDATASVLDFGNIISSNDAGTVVISATGGRTSTLGVTLQDAVAGSQAIFDVTGLAGAHYTILIDNASTLTGPAGATAMTLTNFTHNATQILTGGAETFGVGATLNVNATQLAGEYDGTYDVTVTYN